MKADRKIHEQLKAGIVGGSFPASDPPQCYAAIGLDFAQGITAVARGKAHQDARLELEGRAKRLLERT